MNCKVVEQNGDQRRSEDPEGKRNGFNLIRREG